MDEVYKVGRLLVPFNMGEIALLWLGIDVGGTFTDLVVYDPESGRISLGKVPSTPEDQSKGILDGIASIGIDASLFVRVGHGSTVATNTALERSGADIAVLVTAGHRDILITGRGNRTLMYNIKATAPTPIVARDRCFQIPERLDVTGQVVTPLDLGAVEAAANKLAQENCEAVAICFLHSYANPAHEEAAANVVRNALPDAIVTTSSDVLPEYREHERFSTTALSAYVAPRMRRYLSSLRGRLADTGCTSEVAIMTSSGGTLPDRQIEKLPVLSMLSGPAAGVIAAQFLGKIAGYPNIITCDMGGTSTDVCLMRNGAYTMSSAGKVGIYPVKSQQIDINTVGAGGGSIASYEAGQQLKVGPRSAGAVPGPACYGRGGDEPTVTDANVVLGCLATQSSTGGGLKLDGELAAAAVDRLAGEVGLNRYAMAEGIARIAVVNMTAAIKEISVMRGLDPRDFTLMSYGGAGPLHGTAIADELGISTVLVPPMPANFSAFGLLSADVRRDFVRTHVSATQETDMADIKRVLKTLTDTGEAELRAAGFDTGAQRLEASLDMRYIGQAFELSVPISLYETSIDTIDEDFRKIYAARYGSAPESGSEIVSYRLAAWGVTDKPVLAPPDPDGRSREPNSAASRTVVFGGIEHEAAVHKRAALAIDYPVDGPAIIEEPSTATVVPPGWTIRLASHDCLVLERAS
ncbi:MAG: N-methylhydantoinase A [Hyphomicrobiaceae bacterium]|jgi:N-methylhydantoinase A